MPPSLTLILRHKLEMVCGDVLLTFFDWTHCVAIPNIMSPTRFTSAETNDNTYTANHTNNNSSHTADCNPGQVVYTRASVVNQYNLVPANGR